MWTNLKNIFELTIVLFQNGVLRAEISNIKTVSESQVWGDDDDDEQRPFLHESVLKASMGESFNRVGGVVHGHTNTTALWEFKNFQNLGRATRRSERQIQTPFS